MFSLWGKVGATYSTDVPRLLVLTYSLTLQCILCFHRLNLIISSQLKIDRYNTLNCAYKHAGMHIFISHE